MRKALIIILILEFIFTSVLAILALPKNSNKDQNAKIAKVNIANKTISAEIASTQEEIAKGLSGREYLAPDAGMLFLFPNTEIYTFWMKDTLIPLDIIWIESDPSTTLGMTKGRIVDIKTLEPETPDNVPIYASQYEANYVLEVNASFVAANNIKIGDSVEIKF